jgi:RNA polymerase sigma-70 factor (ECF subfamily)
MNPQQFKTRYPERARRALLPVSLARLSCHASSVCVEDVLPRVWGFALRLSNDEGEAARFVEDAYRRTLDDWELGSTAPLLRLFKAVYWAREGAPHRKFTERHPTERKRRTPIAENSSTLHNEIVHAVDCLPDAERVAILLWAVEGLSNEEVAEILHVEPSAVSARLLRAIRTISLGLR